MTGSEVTHYHLILIKPTKNRYEINTKISCDNN